MNVMFFLFIDEASTTKVISFNMSITILHNITCHCTIRFFLDFFCFFKLCTDFIQVVRGFKVFSCFFEIWEVNCV